MVNYYLFSIDLEDVRDGMSDGSRYKDRVSETTDKYLEFLDQNKVKCTFFIVGKLAERKPDLIRRIIAQGHEIACHTYAHIPLDKLSRNEFREDLKRNLDCLHLAGAHNIIGFRAPVFSLTPSTAWAYEVLEELGIKYSCSVLPAKNPLYGWENFGSKKKIGSIIELPQTLLPFQFFKVPFGGGIYFRMIPSWLLKTAFTYCRDKSEDITGYFHPYDIDTEQERFMHPGIKDSKLFNYFMYYGRASVFSKLKQISNLGFKIIPYRDYLEKDFIEVTPVESYSKFQIPAVSS